MGNKTEGGPTPEPSKRLVKISWEGRDENKISDQEWNEAISQMISQAMEMAGEAEPFSAWGFGGDTRRVDTDEWAAAVEVENNRPIKVKALWVPEHETDIRQPSNWRAVTLPGEEREDAVATNEEDVQNPFERVVEGIRGPNENYEFPYPVSYAGVPGCEVWVEAQMTGDDEVRFVVHPNSASLAGSKSREFYERIFRESAEEMNEAADRLADQARGRGWRTSVLKLDIEDEIRRATGE